MKIQIPEALKEDAPKNSWGKILTATPVIMTVVSTMLAGLASSEMTRAQYSRSLGAQQQAKAGDQWGYFQAKRLRGTLLRSTLDTLQAISTLQPVDPKLLASEDVGATAALLRSETPALPMEIEPAPAIKTAIKWLEAAKPDADIAGLLATVTPQSLIDTERTARERADAFDAATKPVNQAIERLEKALESGTPVARNFTAARLRYTATRYDAEARLNQTVAQVIELEVRKSNLLAERHQRRSQKFFFGMLGAQTAVIVSTFSLAARARSALWTFAAAAGLAAVGFAVYVFFYV